MPRADEPLFYASGPVVFQRGPDLAVCECLQREAAPTVARMLNLAHSQETALPMETAPKDCTMVWLLVDYSDEAADNPLEDAEQAWTIGFNNFDHDGEDVWKFAGWNWEQDCFTEGRGKPIAWRPIHHPVVEAGHAPR